MKLTIITDNIPFDCPFFGEKKIQNETACSICIYHNSENEEPCALCVVTETGRTRWRSNWRETE